jgi:hypothetical protein
MNEDLSGVVKNGLERGWPLNEIATSLLNAGYSTDDVNFAVSNYNRPIQVAIPSGQNPKQLSNYQQKEQKTGNKKGVLILLLILGILVLGALGFLGYSLMK